MKLNSFKPSSLLPTQNNLKFSCFYAIINLPINKNLTATFKMINKLGGDLYD